MARMFALRTLISASLTAALLAGCAARLPELTPEQQNDASVVAQAASDITNEERRIFYILEAADRFQQQGDALGARTLLRSLEGIQLTGHPRTQHLLLSMRSCVELQDAAWATELANTLWDDFNTQLPPELHSQAALLQANTYALAGHYERALRHHIASETLYDANQRRRANQEIWQWINAVSDTELQRLAEGQSGTLTGWAQLASIPRTHTKDPEAQGEAIRAWQKRWSNHPAALSLPDKLEIIASLPEKRPGRIVLALPLSGPLADAGAAVREGFMAAYFNDPRSREYPTRIDVIDGNKGDFGQLYTELAKSSPDLIIGPLDKSALAQLTRISSLEVPVLALNYLEGNQPAPRGLYQFGLSQDDELKQVAQRLQTNRHLNTLVIAPEGAWGERAAQTLRTEIESRGGMVLEEARYERATDLREMVANLFGINRSRLRATQLEQTLGTQLQFEPRRRQDADAVVLIAAPALSRQIKPLFTFYYGADLPVYASSLVYTGRPDRSRDADLDGITFTDIPWTLDNNNSMRAALLQANPRLAAQYDRLFALGADAWLLSTRLGLLEGRAAPELKGMTGSLRMSEQKQILRQQPWARFGNGLAIPLTHGE